jgi:hypothetical protein
MFMPIDSGDFGLDFRHGKKYFSSTQSPNSFRCLSSLLSDEYRGNNNEEISDDYSPPSGVEVENAYSYISTAQYAFITWYLIKHMANFNRHLLNFMH